MFKIIGWTILLVGVTQMAVAEDWTNLDKTDDVAIFIDLDSIQRRQSYVLASVREVQSKPVARENYLHLGFNCETRQAFMVRGRGYVKGPNGENELVEEVEIGTITPEIMEPLQPESQGEAVASFACTWQAMKERALSRLPIEP